MNPTSAVSRFRRRLPLAAGVAAGGVLLLASPAFAHVSVQPGTAEKGGYGTIALKVPNEKDNASTVKLELTLDPQHPLTSVMPQPVPGWDIKVEKSKLDKPVQMHGETVNEAVTKITWSGGKIDPGQFQQFPLSVGPLPKDADQLTFKALQTYSDDDVVRWIDASKPGGQEPEHPAPVLKLVDKAGARTDDKPAAAAPAEKSGSGSDTTARALGGAGIALGAAGVAYGVFAGRRRRTADAS
ncbi:MULTISPECIES: YcnI family copper-binding membrane protein [Streptomyces]|uniref:YcnI family protein n=1 Tax=Streptomyces morookaense TaxID=1970 RepID=A0A7Y7E604_STRMO|nr:MULTISPECIES: YcnI family protein [Streptomyces]MCC2274929.1 YcnI family protein [Streptomyces sp. ET3-23]NVK76697.1 YcnI family protein [Streptomyces morookaense]GHF27137.1 membrane protein [Streptomyces morookaense]